MEVINQKHAEISQNERVGQDSFIRFDASKRAVYFSAGAADEFGMQEGLFVNFINDGDEWLFYCDNTKDGFPLISRKGKKVMLICNSSLVHLFLKRTRCSLPCKFPLEEIKARFQGHPLVKINLHKPMEV